MNLSEFSQWTLGFTSTVNPWLAIALFLITIIGEFGVSVPYLLETLWLLSGYHVALGILPFPYLILLWLSAVAGRQVGSAGLYYVSRFGSSPFMKIYTRFFKKDLNGETPSNTAPFKLFQRINYFSPFSVAAGRLIWLRIPLTITLSIKNRLGTLLLGVLLSGIAWDLTYIILGFIGGNVLLSPPKMILYSLGGLTALYALTFAIKHLPRHLPWASRQV